MKRTCYVVVDQNHDGDIAAYAYYELSDAQKHVMQDMDDVAAILREDGYEPTYLKKGYEHYEICVVDTGIFYEWDIIPTGIE